MRDVLNQQPFFRDDPEETFVKLCCGFAAKALAGPSEYVFRAGDVGRELFFLSRGTPRRARGADDACARYRKGDVRGDRARALDEAR